MDKNRIEELILNVENKLQPQFKKLDEISLVCQEKVLSAFQKNRIALRHFNPTTGYGYDDDGRDTLKKVYADVFKTEGACVMSSIVSGTHAIALALLSVLNGGDRVLSVTGLPYDTIQGVIYGDKFSLKQMGVSFDCVRLKDGNIDYENVDKRYNELKPNMIYIQRSRGYEERESLSVYAIKKACDHVRSLGFTGCIFVDNCYGEFVEDKEATEVGADLLAGSLIKNIGGGIAPCGGYIAGKKKYIDLVEARLTCATIAGEIGANPAGYQYYYQGLFIAPHVVNQALKCNMLIGAAMEEIGYDTVPKAYNMPYDITRSVKFCDEKKLIDFIQSVQKVSPVDSYVVTEPSNMPGYEDKVIMAAGCFVQGSSIELSADAPIRPPYNAYIQGGLTYEHGKLALKEILSKL